MSFTIRPAIRAQTPLFLGVAGPSRSGKTFSALRMATGLAGEGSIVMIDTESGRGLQYADMFKYQYVPLESPFSSERYLEAIEFAKSKGPRVIIVDSASHEHEGPGGMLERHEEELTRMAGADEKKRDRSNFAAWIKPKAAHNKYVNRLLQLGPEIHFIFCFRAKQKLKIVPGKDPIPLGWSPICSDRFEYEMSFLLVLPEGAQGRPDLEALQTGLRAPFGDFIKPGMQLDEDLGKRLAEWAKGTGSAIPATPEKVETISETQIGKLARMMELADVSEAMLCELVSEKTKQPVSELKQIPLWAYSPAVKWLRQQVNE
jgi:hypothetical protein